MVLVSHRHKFIYLKTRKAAGTSIEMALEPFCMPSGHLVQHRCHEHIASDGIVGMRMMDFPDRSLWDRFLSRRRVRWHNHMSASRVKDNLPADQWGTYRKVAAFRNPFDRMVSCFHWRYDNAVVSAGADAGSIRAAFKDFVLSDQWSDDMRVTHVGKRYVIDDHVRYESLETDLGAILRKLGIEAEQIILPVTKHRRDRRGRLPVSAYFDAETAERVRKRMGWVFERIGYSTDVRDADRDMPESPATKAIPQTTEVRS